MLRDALLMHLPPLPCRRHSLQPRQPACDCRQARQGSGEDAARSSQQEGIQGCAGVARQH